MATISFGGLGNGVDFGQVVDQLVKLQRLPIDRLAQKKTTLQTRLTDYGTLGTKLLALQSAADKLRLATGFDRSGTTVSDDTVVTATAASTTPPGIYTIQVSRLATAHQLTTKAAKAVASATADIVGGASATFTFHVGAGANQSVTLGATATLEDLRSAINDLGAGVNASIINAGTEAAPAYRLLLTATDTGAGNQIVIMADTTDLDTLNSSGTGGVDTLQAAQDAIIKLGDPSQTQVTIQRSGNTITDAIPGITLNLKQTTGVGATVAVTVARDTGAVKENVKALVTAYNDIVKFINERVAYDQTTKTGGIFLTEASARGALSQLRQALNSEVSGLATYTSAAQVGFKTGRDGTITLDEGTFDQAISANYGAVRALFINQATAIGIAQRLSQAVDELDAVDTGSVSLRKGAITNDINRLTSEIARKEDGLSLYEERLRRQYAALDGLLRQLQSQSSFLQSRLQS